MSNGKTFLYAGNWVGASSWSVEAPSGCGFGIFEFLPQSGKLKYLKSVFGEVSVGATCVDTKRGILYCVHEVMTLPGHHLGGGGLVYAFAIDSQSGDLKEINHQPSYGSLPSYVAIDATGKYLLLTNHTGRTPITKTARDESGKFRIELEFDEASTVLYALNADGSIGDPVDIHRHHGSGSLPRQNHSQIHSVMTSPRGDLFAVCDKGGDEVVFFRIDHSLNQLKICDGGQYRATPGSSPRYSAFHPNLPYFYANHETKPLITAFKYDETGGLSQIEVISVLPETMRGETGARQSDIRIHPSGKYLYTLIRDVNAVSVFEINRKTGTLQLVQNIVLDGKGPRGCAISPDGRFMLIAALESKEILVWSIAEDGRLSPTENKVAQPGPGNVTFYSA